MSLEFIISAKDEFSKTFSQAESKLNNVGKKMTDIGKSLSLKATAPIIGLGTAAVMTTSKFDTAMSKVQAISGATGDDLEAMREQAKQLGATTVFSASEAADGMEFLARAGFAVSDIMSAMPGMLDLAAASAIDLGVAADITSNIMSGFGIEASKAGMVADVLAAATARSNTSVESMGESMKMVAPVSAGLGISLQETAAAIGILGDAGIQGGMAGTTLRAGLLRLASPTEAVSNAMADMGVEFFDAQGNMKSLTEIVGLLETSMDGMTEQQKVANLEMLFGKNAVSGWMAIIEAGSESLGEFTGDLFESEGAASNMADVMLDNLGGSMVELQSAIEGLAISFGEIMIPIIQNVAEWITELVAWFDGLDEGHKKIIIVVGLLVAALGPLLVMLGMMATAIAAINWPIVLIIGAIAALIAIGVLLYKNWDKIKEWISELWQKIKDFAVNVFNSIVDFFREWGPLILAVITGPIGMLVYAVIEYWDEIKEFTVNLFNSIKDFFVNIWNKIVDFFKVRIEKIVGFFTDGWNFIRNKTRENWEKVIGFLRETIDKVVNFFTNGWNKLKEKTGELWNSLVGVIRAPANAIIGIANGVIGAFEKMLNFVGNAVNSLPSFDVPSWVPGIGGSKFGLPKIPTVSLGRIPSLDIGTDAVLNDGLAMIHEGEAIVPAAEVERGGFNGGRGGNERPQVVNIIVEMDGRAVIRAIGQPLVDEIRLRTGARI